MDTEYSTMNKIMIQHITVVSYIYVKCLFPRLRLYHLVKQIVSLVLICPEKFWIKNKEYRLKHRNSLVLNCPLSTRTKGPKIKRGRLFPGIQIFFHNYCDNNKDKYIQFKWYSIDISLQTEKKRYKEFDCDKLNY